MKLKIKHLLIILLILSLAVSAYVMFRPKEVVPEYVFSYAENQEADYPTTLGGQYFAKLVEERTNGRIKILVMHSGEKGTESEVVKQLEYGGVDFARISLSELTDTVRELNVLQMPYLYESSEHMWKVLDGEIGDYFMEIVSKTEMVGLSWYDAGARNFYTSTIPIRRLEDMKGMKIRVQESNLMADVVECLGAEPIRQAYSEVYSMLEKSEVQGAENNLPSYEAMEHYEVAKYYIIDEHTRIPEIQVCSKHTWEKLSEEDQRIILECAKESALYQRKLWSAQEKESEKLAVAEGAKIFYLPASEKVRFQQAVEPLYERYCKKYMDLIDQIMNAKNE